MVLWNAEKNQDNCTLLYTDTDSLLVHTKKLKTYKDMSEFKDVFDFSDYPKDNPLHDNKNKKVLGKINDECSGTPVSEYIGLNER